jgi:hypothetical protein
MDLGNPGRSGDSLGSQTWSGAGRASLSLGLKAGLGFAGAVLLATACAACGHSPPHAGPARATSSGGSDCPTQGVGGDPQPPFCASASDRSADGGLSIVLPRATAPSASAPLPIVTGISPDSGSESGGDRVTISGRGLVGARRVYFGDARATSVTVDSDSKITVISPSGVGRVEVFVITAESRAAGPVIFFYLPVPQPGSGSRTAGVS